MCSVSFFSTDHYSVCLRAVGERVQHDKKNPASKYREWKEAFFSLIMPLKIKGSIKNENWHKFLGFIVWLRYQVSCLKKIKKRGLWRVSSARSSLCLLSQSVSHSLPLFLLPTSFVQKCLLNKLTVLWRVISKAQRHSMLMLNLFCIHLRWRGLSPAPSQSYSLPSSSRLRAHTWSLLFVLGSMFVFLPPFTPPSLCFFLCKSCDHFSGCVYRDVRQCWCLGAEQS